MAVTTQDVVNWFAANPNATQQQVANAIASAGGLTPTISSAVAQQYGTTPSVVAQQYSALTQPSAPVQPNVPQTYQSQTGTPSFDELVNAVNQGKAQVKNVPYTVDGTQYSIPQLFIDGKQVPYSNDIGISAVTAPPIVDQQGNVTNPEPIAYRLRERTGGNKFRDVNLTFDPSSGQLLPPKQNQFYTSGKGGDGGFFGGQLGNILPALALTYFGVPSLTEALSGGGGSLLGGGAEIGLANDLGMAADYASAANAGAFGTGGALFGGAVPSSTVAGTAGGLLGGTAGATPVATSPLATAAGTTAGTVAGTVAGSALAPAVASALAPVAGSALSGLLNPQTIQGAIGTTGNILQSQADKQAALQAQKDILSATQQAATGAQFRPVGVTTRFGTSQFVIDPTTGQLTSAKYTAAPEIVSAQDQLMKLGAGYLKQTPQEVAQQYMTQQAELLDPLRQRQLADIRNQAFQTGRGGLSVGSTGLRPSGAQGLMGANPELEAYYNAIAQQNAQLAAQAQQAGQQQVGFGTGLFGQAGQLEQLAQQPFTLGTGLGTSIAQAGGTAGRLGLTGAGLGAEYGTSRSATTNPFATILGGAGSPTSTLGQGLAKWLTSDMYNSMGNIPYVYGTNPYTQYGYGVGGLLGGTTGIAD